MTKEIKHQICGDGFIQYRPVKTPRRPFDDDDIQEYARPWKGVSEREIPDIYIGDVAFLHGVKWAEAKLKERNHG